MNSIKNNGYIMSPICVNEKYEVIDGQGRLNALKNLNLPVDFYIVPGAGIEQCVALNAYTTKWTITDYINSYADIGNESYIILRDLIEKYNKLKIDSVVFALNGVDRQNSIIMKGRFKCSKNDIGTADQILEYLDSLRIYLGDVKGSVIALYKSIIFIRGIDCYDKNRFTNQIITYHSLINPIVDMKTALDEMSKMYNRNITRQNRVNFAALYEDYLNHKCVWCGKRWPGKNVFFRSI